VNEDRIVQGLFAIQLTLLGVLLAGTGSAQLGVFVGALGLIVGLISLAGRPRKS
jgi:hypothetical protein